LKKEDSAKIRIKYKPAKENMIKILKHQFTLGEEIMDLLTTVIFFFLAPSC
jgi:hypothetical protein